MVTFSRVLLATFLVTTINGVICGEESPKAELAAKIGDHRAMELTFPKHGFRGAPFSPLSTTFPREPKEESNYWKRLVLVTVVDKREREEGKRIVLRVDDLDSRGFVSAKGVYFCYLDMTKSGLRTIVRYEDDNESVSEEGVRRNLPCPLTYMRPPVLGFKGQTVTDAYFLEGREEGVSFEKKADGKPARVTLSIQHFVRWGPSLTKEGDVIKVFDSKHKRLRDEDKKTKETKEVFKVFIKARETQVWEKADDWLWLSLERYDRDGDLCLRCKQIPVPKADR